MDFGLWIKIRKLSRLRIPSKIFENLEKSLSLEPNIALSIPNYVYSLRSAVVLDYSTITDPISVTPDESENLPFQIWLDKKGKRLQPSDIKCHLETKGLLLYHKHMI